MSDRDREMHALRNGMKLPMRLFSSASLRSRSLSRSCCLFSSLLHAYDSDRVKETGNEYIEGLGHLQLLFLRGERAFMPCTLLHRLATYFFALLCLIEEVLIGLHLFIQFRLILPKLLLQIISFTSK